MAKLENGRAMASPVHAGMLKKRHKFGIDGRILITPIIFPCIVAIPFGHDAVHQLAFAFIAALIWCAAKVAWEINPYLIDDVLAEIKFPTSFAEGNSDV